MMGQHSNKTSERLADPRVLRDPLLRAWWHLNVHEVMVEPTTLDERAQAAQGRWNAALNALLDNLVMVQAKRLATPSDVWYGLEKAINRWDKRTVTPLVHLWSKHPNGAEQPWKIALEALCVGIDPEGMRVQGRKLVDPKIGVKNLAPLGQEVLPALMDPQHQDMLSTYGLTSLTVGCPFASHDEQVRWLTRSHSILVQACERLGIELATWGRVAPHLTLSHKPFGRVSEGGAHYDTENHGIYVQWREPTVDILVHEWVHALDHYTMRRHALPGVQVETLATAWLASSSMGERAAMHLPSDMQRSLALVERIGQEIRGTSRPLLQHGAIRRFMAQATGRLWAQRLARSDRTMGDLHGEAYWSTPTEGLAYFVQHRTIPDHERLPTGAVMLAQARGMMADAFPTGALHATMGLVHAWIENEGLAAPRRLTMDRDSIPVAVSKRTRKP